MYLDAQDTLAGQLGQHQCTAARTLGALVRSLWVLNIRFSRGFLTCRKFCFSLFLFIVSSLLVVCYWLLCLDAVTFVKQQTGRSDYSFHNYMEMCSFIYCLLTRIRKVSSLPELNEWDEYVDPAKMASFELVETSDFLRNHDFGKTLKNAKRSEARAFRGHCREFVDQLVDGILSSQAASSVLMQGLYSFCPELLLESSASLTSLCVCWSGVGSWLAQNLMQQWKSFWLSWWMFGLDTSVVGAVLLILATLLHTSCPIVAFWHGRICVVSSSCAVSLF